MGMLLPQGTDKWSSHTTRRFETVEQALAIIPETELERGATFQQRFGAIMENT